MRCIYLVFIPKRFRGPTVAPWTFFFSKTNAEPQNRMKSQWTFDPYFYVMFHKEWPFADWLFLFCLSPTDSFINYFLIFELNPNLNGWCSGDICFSLQSLPCPVLNVYTWQPHLSHKLMNETFFYKSSFLSSFFVFLSFSFHRAASHTRAYPKTQTAPWCFIHTKPPHSERLMIFFSFFFNNENTYWCLFNQNLTTHFATAVIHDIK